MGAALTKASLNVGRPNPIAMRLGQASLNEQRKNATMFWPLFFVLMAFAVLAVCLAVASVGLASKREEFYEDLLPSRSKRGIV